MNQFNIEDFENLVLKEENEFEQLENALDEQVPLIKQKFKVPNHQELQNIKEQDKLNKNTRNIKNNLQIQRIIQIQIIPTIKEKKETQDNKYLIHQGFDKQIDFQKSISQTHRWSSLEKKAGFLEDPNLDEKQSIFLELYNLIKQIGVKTSQKKHSILEDVLQLCILYLPEIRGKNYQLFSEQLFEHFKEQFKLERTFEAFKRRFHHLALFQNNWTLENIKKIQQLLNNNCTFSFDKYCIEYNIKNKTINLPYQIKQKVGQKNSQQIIQEIIQQSEKKKVVLSMTTKTLAQFVNINPKEIDEDILQFEDEIFFIEMILKLIPLAQLD